MPLLFEVLTDTITGTVYVFALLAVITGLVWDARTYRHQGWTREERFTRALSWTYLVLATTLYVAATLLRALGF